MCAGCHSPTSSTVSGASRSEAPASAILKIDEQIIPGAIRQKFRVEATGREVWVYRPQTAVQSATAIIPACASNGISGGRLSEMDEMLAAGLVQQGLTAVTYDVGEVPPRDAQSLEEVQHAIHSVIDDGGLSDAGNAIAVALMQSPNDRLISLGQGAASSLALRAAKCEKRIDACVMIDPPASIKSGSLEILINALAMPELDRFLQTDDFAPLARRTSVPAVVVSIVVENGDATFKLGDELPAQSPATSLNSEFVQGSAIKIVSSFPTDLLPEQGFVQIAQWIHSQSGGNALHSSSASR